MELPSFYEIFLAPAARLYRFCYRHCRLGQGLAGGLVLVLMASTTQAAGYTAIQLKQAAANFLTKHYAHQGRLEISVGNLDSRIKLAQCQQPLAFTAKDTSGNGGNISVQVQCQSQPSWSVHIPAQVSIFREIPVAQRDLARGERINAGDITWESLNISQIRQSYYTLSEQIIGQEVKRNIGRGSAFINSALDAPTLIKRGESVELQSALGGIQVIANGTALGDGRLGQKIRIKNNQSDRIVTGTVIASGKVATH